MDALEELEEGRGQGWDGLLRIVLLAVGELAILYCYDKREREFMSGWRGAGWNCGERTAAGAASGNNGVAFGIASSRAPSCWAERDEGTHHQVLRVMNHLRRRATMAT